MSWSRSSFRPCFAVGAFAYVSWVFPGSGWSFFAAPAESLSAWSAGVARVFGDGFTGSLTLDAALAILHRACARRTARRRRARNAFAAAAAGRAGRWCSPRSWSRRRRSPSRPASSAIRPPLWSRRRCCRGRRHARAGRARAALAVRSRCSLLGWFGGAAGIGIVDPRDRDATPRHGRRASRRPRAARCARRSAAPRSDAMACWSTPTMRPPSCSAAAARTACSTRRASRSRWRMLFGRLATPFVAVPDPQSITGASDRLNKTFPPLYRHGAPGYRARIPKHDLALVWRISNRAYPKINRRILLYRYNNT